MKNEKIMNNDEPAKELASVIKVGKETIRVVSIFGGTKTSSELIYNAAVRKVLYDSQWPVQTPSK